MSTLTGGHDIVPEWHRDVTEQLSATELPEVAEMMRKRLTTSRPE